MSPRLKRQSDRFLCEVRRYCADEALPEVDLLVVPTPNSFGLNNSQIHARDIIRIAQEWQDEGLGVLRLDGRPYFSFSIRGRLIADQAIRRLEAVPWSKRLQQFNWNAVGAVAAMIAAVAAVVAAYFSYLALIK